MSLWPYQIRDGTEAAFIEEKAWRVVWHTVDTHDPHPEEVTLYELKAATGIFADSLRVDIAVRAAEILIRRDYLEVAR